MIVAPLPRRCAHTSRVGSYGSVSSPFSLSLLVCLSTSLKALLTRVMHCLELILPHAMCSVLLSMPLGTFLYLGTNPSLDRSHRLRPIEAVLYSIVLHQDYMSCVFLCNPGEYISLEINSSLKVSPQFPPFVISFLARSSMFPGGIYV